MRGKGINFLFSPLTQPFQIIFTAKQWQQHQCPVLHPLLLPVQRESPEPGMEFYEGRLFSICQSGEHVLVGVFLQQGCS